MPQRESGLSLHAALHKIMPGVKSLIWGSSHSPSDIIRRGFACKSMSLPAETTK
jgi:hypothetical protein